MRSVGKEDIVFGVDGNAIWEAQPGPFGGSAIAGKFFFAATGDSDDCAPVRVHFADAVMRPVDDQEVALFVQRDAERQVQIGLSG